MVEVTGAWAYAIWASVIFVPLIGGLLFGRRR